MGAGIVDMRMDTRGAKFVETEFVVTESIATESIATESIATEIIATEIIATESAGNHLKTNDKLGAMDLDEKRVKRRRTQGNEKQENEKQGKEKRRYEQRKNEKRNGLPSLHQRVHQIAWHIPWYAFKTQARLAQDSGVSPAAISRLIRGESQPSLSIALRVTGALSGRMGRPLDVSEVFSLDGIYPTPSVCVLTGCRNCLPPTAYEKDDQLRTEFEGIKAGQWSMSNLTPQEVHEA